MLDPDDAALLLKLVGERLQQNGVLRLPAHKVEVAGRLLVSLVMCLEPAGPEAGLVACQVLRGPGRVHVGVVSLNGHGAALLVRRGMFWLRIAYSFLWCKAVTAHLKVNHLVRTGDAR